MPRYHEGKPVSLDFLGYQFDAKNKELREKLHQMANYREERAAKIMDNLNAEFEKEGIEKLRRRILRRFRLPLTAHLGDPTSRITW